MRLSEAIRLGAMLKPQGIGSFFDPATGGTCALGAALDAIGCLNKKEVHDPKQNEAIDARWPYVSHQAGEGTCPKCGKRHSCYSYVIWHLNDEHSWTREQIADWVATLEDAPDTETVDARSDAADRHPVEIA